MAKKKTLTERKLDAAFKEVHDKTPRAVEHTERKFGKERAEKQRVAIALSKARAAGAKIPDKSGANFVTANALHRPDGSPSFNRTRGSEFVPYKPSEAYASEPVGETLQPKNPCEATRAKSNAARDARTNLGRGKAAVCEIE